jgi:hypothetical protein
MQDPIIESTCTVCRKEPTQTQCQNCKSENVCSSCLAFRECCKVAPVSLEAENRNLQVEIELLRYENQRLKERIEKIRVVALQGINDCDTTARTQ